MSECTSLETLVETTIRPEPRLSFAEGDFRFAGCSYLRFRYAPAEEPIGAAKKLMVKNRFAATR